MGALLEARQQAPGAPEDFAKAAADEFTEAFTAVAFDPAMLAARRGSVGCWGCYRGWSAVRMPTQRAGALRWGYPALADDL